MAQARDELVLPARGGGLDIGICCSGGGIRAAAYALGCLQALGDADALNGPTRARYISAVSGGSYAVGSMALVELSRVELSRMEAVDGDVAASRAAKPLPYAAGTPELHRLRTELGYLTNGPGGLRSEVWRALMGVVINLGLFVSGIAFTAVIAGWVYGNRYSQIRALCGSSKAPRCATSIHPGWFAITVVVVPLTVALVVGIGWVLRRWPANVVTCLQSISVSALLVAVGVAVLVLGAPQVLAWLHRASLHGRGHSASTLSSALRHQQVTGGAAVGVLAALAGVLRSAWNALGSLESNSLIKGLATDMLSKGKKALINLVASIAVPLLAVGLIVAFAFQGAQHSVFVSGTHWTEWIYLLVPVVFVVPILAFGDINSWSLHAIYRSRLSDAFNVERVPSEAVPRSEGPCAEYATPNVSGKAQIRQRGVELSELAKLKDRFPEVLICAASNVRNQGLAPTGMNAASFVLSGDCIGGEFVGTALTSKYIAEAPSALRPLTVMDAVSISGAAVSPEMGKMTRAPLRFLMALANIRLGVWLPKPDRPLRQTRASRRGKAAAKPKRAKTPSLVYLMREAFATTPPDARDVYVTDGGHYDNLGVVELLRRRCRWIWCIDASGDSTDTFSTIGGALAIAQAELQIHIDGLNPQTMKPVKPADWKPDDTLYVNKPFCTADFTYPATDADPEQQGTIVIVKAGVAETAPWAVRYYQDAHPTFPCDSTLDQLYTAERFDAYLALGRYSMQQAIDETEGAYNALKLQIATAALKAGERADANVPS